MTAQGQTFDLTTGRTFLDGSDTTAAAAAALFGAIIPFATHAVRFEERAERADGRHGYIPSEDDDAAEFYILLGDMRRALNAALAYYLLSHGWTYEFLAEGYEGQEAAVWKGCAGEQFIVLTEGVRVPLVSCELRAHLLKLIAEGRTPRADAAAS